MTISIIKNNTQKYNNAVKKNTPLFVKFYSKHCGACVAMEQEWNKFTKQMKQYQGNVAIAEIETKQLNYIYGFNQVVLVPTIVLLNKGEIVDEYHLPRTAKSMILYLKHKQLIHKHTRTHKHKRSSGSSGSKHKHSSGNKHKLSKKYKQSRRI